MSKRSKYQLPHYDRVHPLTRNAINIGIIYGQMQERGAMEGMTDEEVHNWSRRVFRDPKTWVDLKHASDPFIRDYWEKEYEERGDGIGRSFRHAWNEMLSLQLLNPGVALNRQASAFAYAEVTAAHQYDRYGRQAFSIMPMLAEMFENTDLGDLTLADLHLPFQCFYVSLEESKIPLLDGFYVHKRQDAEGDVLSFVGFGFKCDPDHVNETWPEDYKPRSDAEHMNRDGYFRYHFEIQLNRSRGKIGDKDRPVAPLWTGVPLEEVIDRIHSHPDLVHVLDTARGYAGLGLTDMDPSLYAEEVSGVAPVDELSRYMVKMAMSLLLYLNSDERSGVTTSDRAEAEEADQTAREGKGSRSKRKRRKGREARERRKFLSTANVTRVGGKETAKVTSRDGFSFDQPRHWRRGHFHRYWTGPVKIDGVRIPYEEWEDKRTLKRIWTLPALINPDGEIEEVTTRTVVRRAQEALASALTEGKMIPIPEQSKRERSAKARKLCLEHHGRVCSLCEDDGARFGDAGGWLHVHHLDRLGDAVAERNVDPKTDLVPLCATCHGFIHSRKPMLSLEEAREIIESYDVRIVAK